MLLATPIAHEGKAILLRMTRYPELPSLSCRYSCKGDSLYYDTGVLDGPRDRNHLTMFLYAKCYSTVPRNLLHRGIHLFLLLTVPVLRALGLSQCNNL